MHWWMWGDWLPLRTNPSRGSYIDAGRCIDREDLTSTTGSVSASWPFGSGDAHSDENETRERDNPACWMMLRSSLFSRTRFWTCMKWKTLQSHVDISLGSTLEHFTHKVQQYTPITHIHIPKTKTVSILQYQKLWSKPEVTKHAFPVLQYLTKHHTALNILCTCTSSKIY